MLLGGYVDRVTDWCVTSRGFAPRHVQLWIKFSWIFNFFFFHSSVKKFNQLAKKKKKNKIK